MRGGNKMNDTHEQLIAEAIALLSRLTDEQVLEILRQVIEEEE